MHSKNKLAKKAVAMGLSCALALSAFGTPSFSSASAAGSLTAAQITEEMKIGWNVGNSLDSTPSTSDVSKHETAWGNPVVTQELIDAVKAKGFNTIRIPTTWYPHVSNDGSYTIDPAWLARVKEVVDYAYNQDMYVILNVHHEEWINRADFGTAYDEMSPKLKAIWKQIATYFKDYDQHLVFEGMNEPRAVGTDYEWAWGVPDECYDVINKLDADFVNTVRSVDSPYKDSRLLMIPTYAASQELHNLVKLEFPADDDYIAASVHAYSPYDFAMDAKGTHDEFTESHEAYLDTMFKNIQATFTDKDIPVVIGEFGTSEFDGSAARTAREEWADYYLTWTSKLGIPCVLWDNNAVGNSDQSEIHAYINRSTYEWYENGSKVVDAMMTTVDKNASAWGSEAHKPTYSHKDLSTGTVLWEGDLTSGDEGVIAPLDLSKISNGEIAVKFTGASPKLAFMDAEWGSWTEVSPYDVDEANGIAYFNFDEIKKAWGGDVSTIASAKLLSSGTSSSTTLVVSLGEPSIGTKPVGTTTTVTTTTTKSTTVTTASPVDGKEYEIKVGDTYTYSKMGEDERMIGFKYEDFGIGANEKVKRVEVTVSAIASKVGKWQGAFGSSTTVEPECWTMTDDMEQTISGKSGTIVWDVDDATSAIIQTQYGGEVKFGVWWIDCDTFKIDSVKIITDGNGSTVVTTTTTNDVPSGGYKLDLNQKVVYADLPAEDKMIGWEWSKFGIGANEKIQKVEINISTPASKIGTWQGAFGSSTSVEPEHWTQTDDMEQVISGKSGTITWDIDSATSEIIQTQYGGELKWGIWWIDCGTINIDSIVVYTDKNGPGPVNTTTTTKLTTTTTTKTTTTTGNTTTTTKTPKPDGYTWQAGEYWAKAGDEGLAIAPTVYNDPGSVMAFKCGFKFDMVTNGALKLTSYGANDGEPGDAYPDFSETVFETPKMVAAGKGDAGAAKAADGSTLATLYYDVADEAAVAAAASKMGIKLQEDAEHGKYYSFPLEFDTTIPAPDQGPRSQAAIDGSEDLLDINFVSGSVNIIVGDVVTTTTTTTATSDSTTTTTTTTGNSSTTTTVSGKWNDLIGDTNLDGRVGVQDIIKLNKYLLGQVQLNAQALRNATCKDDGSVNTDDINIDDLISLEKYLVDLIPSLPEK